MLMQRLFYSFQVVLFVQNLRLGLLRTPLSWGSAREGAAVTAGAARTRISKNQLVGVKITWGSCLSSRQRWQRVQIKSDYVAAALKLQLRSGYSLFTFVCSFHYPSRQKFCFRQGAQMKHQLEPALLFLPVKPGVISS